MAVPNEVRVNIRHHILLLKTFTVSQLQAITGLNRQSIHTELRRMKQEGLLFRVGTEEGEKGSSGGRPAVVYQLTSDLEKRFEVLQSLRAFYVAAQGGPSEFPRPESKHYFIAKDLLEEATKKGTALTLNNEAAYLDLIRQRLEYARQEEEVGEENTQLIAAIFNILEAKAVDTLAGDWERAIVLLDDARRDCRQSGADDLIAEVQACVRTIAARMAEYQLYFDEINMYEKVEEMAQNLRIIKHRFGDLSEVSTYVRQAERLAAKIQQERISIVAEQQARLYADALNQRTTVVVSETPAATEERLHTGEPEARFLASRTCFACSEALLGSRMREMQHRSVVGVLLEGRQGVFYKPFRSLLQRRPHDMGPGLGERSPQTDDWVRESSGPARMSGSERLRKQHYHGDNE